LKTYFTGRVVTMEKIEEASKFFEHHFGDSTLFNREGWEYILNKYNGHLPVSIKAVPEGECVPVKNVLLTIENTDPKCYWLPNYLETVLVQLWYPCTVATSSREQKKILKNWLIKTGSDLNSLPFKLHDFGYRGVSSVETASIGSMSHLVNFQGTDTMAGIKTISQIYNYKDKMAGFSIPASEHSTMTSWGQHNELNAYSNMLKQYPKGLVACVSDSWDVFKACKYIWGDKLRHEILNRQGTLVVRPDSGDPVETVCRVLDILGGVEDPNFGFGQHLEFTTTGHKLLPKNIRIIQGDGIDIESIEKILCAAAQRGWAADNLAFGSGGALLQKLNRDTLKFAFKCSYVIVDGEGREVFKDPITDPGKKSKKGRLRLQKKIHSDHIEYETLPEDELCTSINDSVVKVQENILAEVFRDGNLLVDWNFDEIRSRASI